MKWFRHTPLESARWVVIDCETSGLDIKRDRLLSVGALAVRGNRVELADSSSGLVQQATPSPPENILVHGISGDAQLAGRPVRPLMNELATFISDGFPVAFHAAFDAAMLRRAGVVPQRDWLDLAVLMPVLFPERGLKRSSLDDWLEAFAIAPLARHDALGDAFATAQLFLVALAQTRRQGIKDVSALARVARAHRWPQGL